MLSDPQTLNPLAAVSTQAKDIIEMLFLKLMKEGRDFTSFEPELAHSWEFSADSLAITFHLRKDVEWSDGVPCTAGDVEFTWKCEVDTAVGWPGRNMKDRIASVEAIDSFTVVFRFENRYPYQLMDANDGVIVPEHVLGKIPRKEIKNCGFGRKPVGDGPFVLSRWVPDQYVELEKNHLYYEKGKPRIDRVVFRIVPDMLTLLTQLKTGEIDCLESIPPDEAESIARGDRDIRIYEYPSRSMVFIAWNLGRPLFGDRETRRALALAVNRRVIIENVWRGYADECKSPMHPLLWPYDDEMEPIGYDPDAASAVLAKAGWNDEDGDGVLERNGDEFSFELITNYGNQQRMDIATMVQAYLREVGIKVNIRVLEWNTFIEKVINSDYDACVMGWKVGTRADLTEFWHSSSARKGGFNISGYKNREVDSLIERARNTLDRALALDLWRRSQRLIYDDQPFMFIAVPQEIYALSARFDNVAPSPISFFYNLPDWRIRE